METLFIIFQVLVVIGHFAFGVLLGLLILKLTVWRKKYYFYHITYYRVSDGAQTGNAMGHVFNNFWWSIDPLKAYEKVKQIAIQDCPSDSTWSIDLVQRNK